MFYEHLFTFDLEVCDDAFYASYKRLTDLYRLSEYGRQSHSRSPLSFINWAHKTGVATAEVYLPLESLYATTTLDVRMIPVLYPLLVLDH